MHDGNGDDHERTGGYGLTPEEERTLPPRVKSVLASHVGRGAAITARSIADCLGLRDPRGSKIRLAIAILRAQDEPIAANLCGFYYCKGLPDAIDYMDRLDHILEEDRQVKLKFRRAVQKHFGWDPDQPPLL